MIQHAGLIITEEEADSVLTGFTLTNGSSNKGGGIRCIKAHPTVSNLIITFNHANEHGGAVYCRYSSPVITNCIMAKNTADRGAAT